MRRCNGASTLEAAFQAGFSSGRSADSQAVTQPLGLLPPTHLAVRRRALLDPAKDQAVPECSTSSAQTLQGEREAQEKVIQ